MSELSKYGYFTDNGLIFCIIYFSVYLIFFAILKTKKFGKNFQYLTKIALVFYIIAGFIYLPMTFATYETGSWQILLGMYAIYFSIFGTIVFITLIISFIRSVILGRKNRSVLFSLAYTIPVLPLILLYIYIDDFGRGKTLANAFAEPFFVGVITSVIYLLDYKFNFSVRLRTIMILTCILAACLIGVFLPSLPE